MLPLIISCPDNRGQTEWKYKSGLEVWYPPDGGVRLYSWLHS
jgi:hypothetical protein